MTPTSEKLRELIRQGAVECICPWSIREKGQHLNDCQWYNTVVEIYRLEREDENISSDIQRERGADEGQEPDDSSQGRES
mgnify:CR=1 FL=1